MSAFFGFAIADSMFPLECIASRNSLTLDEVRGKIPAARMYLNPSAGMDCQVKKSGCLLDFGSQHDIIEVEGSGEGKRLR